MKILITPRGFASYGLDQVKLMQEKGFTVHYNDTGKAYTPDEFKALASEVDGIIVGVDLMDRAMMEGCPNLKVVCKFGVGLDNIDQDYAKERNILVGRTVGSNSLSVAEHVIAMMFAESKNIVTTVTDVKDGKWNKPTGREISGKSIGIIGFGQIGKHLARLANGLGMQVFAYDAFDITEQVAKDHHITKSSYDDILKNCDYISLHIPLTEETKNMIGQTQFEVMKKDACLLNSARGGIVNESELYQALVTHKIRSACFDVFSIEPPASTELLLTLDNFLLTPHTASRTIESEENTCKISTQIVVDHLLNK